jgi:hypothetical protein
MPNDRKKYRVDENRGMKLDDDGGIAIYVAAEQPERVPDGSATCRSKRNRPTCFSRWSPNATSRVR